MYLDNCMRVGKWKWAFINYNFNRFKIHVTCLRCAQAMFLTQKRSPLERTSWWCSGRRKPEHFQSCIVSYDTVFRKKTRWWVSATITSIRNVQNRSSKCYTKVRFTSGSGQPLYSSGLTSSCKGQNIFCPKIVGFIHTMLQLFHGYFKRKYIKYGRQSFCHIITYLYFFIFFLHI